MSESIIHKTIIICITIFVCAHIQACKPDVETFITKLSDGDPGERSWAARKLREIGNPRAVPALIEVLKDNDRVVRYEAAITLGMIGDDRAVDPLIAALNHSDVDLRTQAVFALGKIGSARALEPLIEVLKYGDMRAVKEGAEWALEKFYLSACFRALSDAFDSRESEDVRNFSERFEKIIKQSQHEKEAIRNLIAPLMDALHSSDEEIRNFANFVLNVSTDLKYRGIRISAAIALGDIGDIKAAPSLIEALEDSDKKLREYAAEALGNIGDTSVVLTLIARLKDTEREFRDGIALALGEIGDTRAVDPLIEIFETGNNDIRGSVAIALGKIDTARCEEVLFYAFEKDDTAVIVAAHKYFISKGRRKTEDAMIRALNAAGNEDMLLFFLNSGNKKLEEAGRSWAKRNGYTIQKMRIGGISSKKLWGSRR